MYGVGLNTGRAPGASPVLNFEHSPLAECGLLQPLAYQIGAVDHRIVMT